MNPTTLAALQSSIKKWEGIVDGTKEDEGVQNCALCHRFWNRGNCKIDETDGVEVCPVRLKTGLRTCEGTPYTDWIDVVESEIDVVESEDSPSFFADTPEKVELAKAELKFLQSLLP